MLSGNDLLISYIIFAMRDSVDDIHPYFAGQQFGIPTSMATFIEAAQQDKRLFLRYSETRTVSNVNISSFKVSEIKGQLSYVLLVYWW